MDDAAFVRTGESAGGIRRAVDGAEAGAGARTEVSTSQWTTRAPEPPAAIYTCGGVGHSQEHVLPGQAPDGPSLAQSTDPASDVGPSRAPDSPLHRPAAPAY